MTRFRPKGIDAWEDDGGARRAPLGAPAVRSRRPNSRNFRPFAVKRFGEFETTVKDKPQEYEVSPPPVHAGGSRIWTTSPGMQQSFDDQGEP